MLVVTNDIRLSQAIVRFLQFLISESHTPVDYNQFKKEHFNNMDSFSAMIMDVYEDLDGKKVSTGLQYGLLFENDMKCLSYFYTDNGLKKPLKLKDLSPNCFYLPAQLTEFLQWIRNMQPVPGSSLKLQNYFLSSPLTNDHN